MTRARIIARAQRIAHDFVMLTTVVGVAWVVATVVDVSLTLLHL